MARDPSNEVEAITTEPSVVADDAEQELDVAKASEPDSAPGEEPSSASVDPTATTALESDLRNLKDAAEALDDGSSPA